MMVKKSKRNLVVVLLFLVLIFTTGCSQLIQNEIYNKSYHVTIDLEEFEDLITAAVEKTSPAIIGVSNYERGKLGLYGLSATGSGVIYECEATYDDGVTTGSCSDTMDSDNVMKYTYWAVTNRHVVASEVDNYIKVYLGEEEIKISADVLGYDDKVDLAVIAFEHTKYIQPVEFADSNLVQRGNFAIAIGNPNGYEFYGSATFGIVSFPKRYMSDDTDDDGISDWDSEYIQHDVAINPGNSGGALINIEGKLIGINTLKLVSEDTDNMGFAIPSNLVQELIPILERGEKPTRQTLKISVFDVKVLKNPEDYPGAEVPEISGLEEINFGLYVAAVEITGPAYGYLQEGDIILKFEGVEIKNTQTFRSILNNILEGETATIEIYRGQETITVVIPF
ncbi:MAG: trypsin-like peptidase domain-containing protein [Bacilli bacterium]|nr:trypsin-like peptidase domain-containing protein [Bacilli bacterium]